MGKGKAEKRKSRRKEKEKWQAEKAARNRKLDKESEILRQCRENANKLIPRLRSAGCDLAFYDFLDSYADEFNEIIETALQSHKSLHAVNELPLKLVRNTDWTKYAPADFKQLHFELPDDQEDYAKQNTKSNLNGHATFFLDSSECLRSIITIEKNPKGLVHITDLQYAFKVASLLHEIGHVDDAEKGINIRTNGLQTTGLDMNVVPAEVYANVFALNELSRRCLRHSYLMFYEAISKMAATPGYVGEIGAEVMSQHQFVDIPDWQKFLT